MLAVILSSSVFLGLKANAVAQTTLLSSNTPAAFQLITGSYANGSIQSVPGEPFTQAWTVNVTTAPPAATSVALTASTSQPVNKGDAIIATFYYRRTDTISDELNITASFQQAGSAATSIAIPLRGREQWRQISVPFISAGTYAAGGAVFTFALGAQVQGLQISGVTLSDYGQKSLLASGSTDATSLFAFKASAGTTTYATDTTGVGVSGNALFATASQINVTTAPPTGSENYVHLVATVPSTVANGDTLVAIFWVRDVDSPAALAITGMETLNASGVTTVSENAEPLIVDGNWKQHIIAFKATTNYAANGMAYMLYCGAQVQKVQFAGLQLLDFGTAVAASSLTTTQYDYPGRLLSDSWRTAANARIAQYRTGPLNVTVTGAGGTALTGINVSAAMQKHHFGFGTVTHRASLTSTDSDSLTYQSNLASLFNKAVLEFELDWGNWEGSSSDDQNALTAIDWLLDHGIFDIRGHTLVWPSWADSPSALQSLSGSGLTKQILTDIDNESKSAGLYSYLTDWDVLNEPYTERDILNSLNGNTTISGTQDVTWVKSWFAQTAQDDAYPMLYLNDDHIVDEATHLRHPQEDYDYTLIQSLQQAGAPVDGMGFESHMTAQNNTLNTAPAPIVTLKGIFDRFAGLGVREEVTEFDQNIPDHVLQADFLADYMTLAFSEPNFDSFTMWGFWDGEDWLSPANAPIFNLDWSLKPSGESWKGLVHGKWWTNAAATSNSSGVAAVTGYLGRYAVTASSGGITKTYYTDLPSTAGAKLQLELTGSTGTHHVWLHEADQGVIYSPFVIASDSTAYDGKCVTSATSSGTTVSATEGLLRINTEATGTVNIWLRMITPSSHSNSFFVSVDGATWLTPAFNSYTTWHWQLLGQYNLATGTTHTVSFADRKGGTELDQVLLTDDLSFTP